MSPGALGTASRDEGRRGRATKRGDDRLAVKEYRALRPKFKRGDRVRRATGHAASWREGFTGHIVSVHQNPWSVAGGKAKYAFWYGVVFDVDLARLSARQGRRVRLRPFSQWNGYGLEEEALVRLRTKRIDPKSHSFVQGPKAEVCLYCGSKHPKKKAAVERTVRHGGNREMGDGDVI